MKSLLKYASTLGFVIATLTLTACSGQPNFDVTLDNGRDLAIETDHIQLTNQELFELVASGLVNGVNPGVLTILDWADYIILSDLVEIDEEIIEEELAFIEEFFDEDEIEEILITQGFNSLEDYSTTVRLALMREQAVRDAVEIDERDILDVFNTYFVPTDESDDTDDEDTDIDDEAPTFEELRDSIEDVLRNEILQTPGFEEEVLAGLRAEAGLTIYSSYFATRYESLLEAWRVDDIDVATGNNNSVVASINGQYLTNDELFNIVVVQFAFAGQSQLLNHIDLNILDEIYDVDHDVIRANISQTKLNLLDWFYPQMEHQGLFTERQIFNFFFLEYLQYLALNEAFIPISEERLQVLYELHIEQLEATFETENIPLRSARHILVSDVALAEDIIEQLQAVDADEFEDLFIALAEEHSTCDSAENGGDLGPFGPGAMVPPFEEATFALELYEFTTEPVETQFGYHVIYLYDIEELDIDLDIPTFEEIRTTLIDNETQRIHTSPHYLAYAMFNIRADHQIRFHNEQLQAQYDTLAEQIRRRMED